LEDCWARLPGENRQHRASAALNSGLRVYIGFGKNSVLELN
jgi:hypothetical protein